MPSRRIRALHASAVLALAASLAGCSGYFSHNDTVSASAGDAVDANIAIQTIDPWPLASSQTEILYNGNSTMAAAGATPVAAAAAAPVAAMSQTPTGTDQTPPSE